MIQYGLFFVLSPRGSAMSGIFVLDLGWGSLVTNTSCGSRGGALRGPAPTPLFLDQNEARRADKKKSAPLLSPGLDDPPPPLTKGLDPPLNT